MLSCFVLPSQARDHHAQASLLRRHHEGAIALHGGYMIVCEDVIRKDEPVINEETNWRYKVHVVVVCDLLSIMEVFSV